MALRVLTWNLMHGRSLPPAHRELLAEFAAALQGWEWDVALLQEVPPWWPEALGSRLNSTARLVLTSRNALLPARRAIATRWPDAIKSNGGGCNAILVRHPLEVSSHRTLRLRLWPERRWLHAVRLDNDTWVGNLHATVHDEAAALREAGTAANAMLAWADRAPSVLGGDFNVERLSLNGFGYAGGFDVDHVFVAGLSSAGEPMVLEHGPLSDHAPVLVTVGA